MMRYQRVSPDCLHLNNGRKQANLRTYKDEDASENGRFPSYGHSFDGKAAPLRYRSGTTPPRQDHSSFSHFIASTDTPQSDGHTATATQKNQNHENSPSPSPSRGGDLLLQWGHNKRSRGSRAENRTVTDESSIQPRPLIKLQRRGGFDKHGIINQQQIMPPPPPPPPPTCSSSCTTTTHGRGGNLRSFSVPVRDTTGSPLNRNPEDRSGLRNGSSSSNSGAGASSRVGGGVSRSADKRSPSSPEKTENRKMGSSTVTNMVNEKQQQQQQMVMMMNGGSMGQADHGSRVESTAGASAEQGGGGGGVSNGVPIGAGGGMEKVNLEVLEWPRIYVSLSRKEKEDDFYAMKGTKLPQRPKKRAKNIDKTLQYCFPGMWLSDLTRGRYEVREKKCVKKQKRRGLKGMESMESDSE